MLSLNLKKKEILFCLSFASTFNLYLFDFLNIKNYFFIPIIYQDSYQLFLYSILFMFFIFFIALLLFHCSANNYTIKKIIILLLSVLTFEAFKDYFNLKLSLEFYIPLILLLILITILKKNLAEKISRFFINFISIFFIFFFISIFISIKKYDERNFNFDDLHQIKKVNNKMKVVIVFDELDWRILNEKKYRKYNFTSNFDQLLVKSNIYENSFINGDATKTNLLSIINNKDFNLKEVNKLIYEFKNNKMINIKKYENNLFYKLYKNNKNIGFVGYYLQECKVYEEYFKFCHYLNNGYKSKNKFIHDFSKYLITQIIPGMNKLISAPKENVFLKQKTNFNMIHENLIKKLISSNLDIVFMHIPFPHGPYIYDIENKMFKDFYSKEIYRRDLEIIDHKAYIGNVYLANMILEKIIIYEKKFNKKIDYYILSDTGINKDLDDYQNLNSSKYNKSTRSGHTTLFIKYHDQSKKKIISQKTFIPEILHNSLMTGMIE